MSIAIVALITITALIVTVVNSGFIGYPLILGLCLFGGLALAKGHAFKHVFLSMYRGAKKALVVLRVFIFIGGITGVWLVSGTVASLIDLGLSLLHPQWFVLFAFLIPAGVSFLLGTSFGTISTVGVALMLIGRGAGLPEPLVAGAIISGSYFGDRNSPMSSSANLVASLTGTDLHQNVKDMFRTAIIPLLLTLVFYGVMSLLNPLKSGEIAFSLLLKETYQLGIIPLLPAIIILVLGFMRKDVKWAMAISIGIAGFIGVLYQNIPWQEVLKSAVLGYQLPSEHVLATYFKGGGVISMLKPSIVVTAACALAGLMEGTQMLKSLEIYLERIQQPTKRFGATLLTSLAAASFGCNQTIAIVFTEQLMDKAYRFHRRNLAIGIENSAVLLAALIPWNIAALVPTTTLNVSPAGFIPYAVFLYLVPLGHLLLHKRYSLD